MLPPSRQNQPNTGARDGGTGVPFTAAKRSQYQPPKFLAGQPIQGSGVPALAAASNRTRME